MLACRTVADRHSIPLQRRGKNIAGRGGSIKRISRRWPGGLLARLGDFDVSVSPLSDSALLRIRGDDGHVARWTLTHFVPDDGYVRAMAVEHPDPAVSYNEWGATH